MKPILFLLPLLLFSCKKQQRISNASIDLSPTEGVHKYRFTAQEKNTSFSSLNEVIFDLVVDRNGTQTVNILKIGHSDFDAEIRNYTIDDSCRKTFNGDSTKLGSFTLGTFKSIYDIVPRCIDIRSTDVLANLINLLRIQGTSIYNISNLSKAFPVTVFNQINDSWTTSTQIYNTCKERQSQGLLKWHYNDQKNILTFKPFQSQYQKLFIWNNGQSYFYNGIRHVELILEIDNEGNLIRAYNLKDNFSYDMWINSDLKRIPPWEEYYGKRPDQGIDLNIVWKLERL